MQRHHLSLALVGWVALGVAGCFEESIDPGPTADGGGGGGQAPSLGGSGPSGDGGEGGAPAPSPRLRTISGDVTWHVSFDDTAVAAGAIDCQYTRHYEGQEDASARWLCPSCEVMFRATVEMAEGLDDCYSQVSDAAPAAAEWIGYGGGRWHRSVEGPTTDQGSVDIQSRAITTKNVVKSLDALAGGKMSFHIEGGLALSEGEGDKLHGFVPPASYACGWPKSDAPPYEGDWTLSDGATVPDGLFYDACEEVVRLQDFAGSYLIIDMAARDCPPCRAMAGDEEAFVADMAAEGIDVRVITLLAPSLADTLGTTTTEMLQGWIDNYELTSPVLADRGWGLAMFGPLFGDPASYPSWVIVRPDLTVLGSGQGFADFEEHKTAIEADQ